MAIAEFTKQIIFNTTQEQAEHLNTVPNKSAYIREAIAEKMEREKEQK
jgi:hypothetical protein